MAAWFQGKSLPTPALTAAFEAILDLLGASADERETCIEALARIRNAPGPRPRDSAAPYRGLLPYEPEDAESFAGRDGLTAQLASLVTDRSAAGGLSVVIGPSGSGKTSLIRAGLIAAVQRETPAVRCVVIVPGLDPVAQLRDLAEEPDGPAGEATTPAAGRIGTLLVVDQFEQLFLACPQHAQRAAFVDALASAAVNGPDTRVVLVLRSDFYTRALEFPRLLDAMQRGHMLVGPMSEAELRQAVTVPADRAGVSLKPGLIDVVLRDLTPLRARTDKDEAYEAGALPLLSHALYETWKIARSRTLTLEHYRDSGGIVGAVAKTAEEAYTALATAERQDLARRLFLRLVQAGDDLISTRRRLTWVELHDLDDDEDEWREVLDVFIAARLLTADEDRVEIAHEALLSAWPRLTEWLDADHGWRRLHHRLRTATTQWTESGNSTDALYRGGILQTTMEAVDRGYHRELSRPERQFLHESTEHQHRAEQTARKHARWRYQLATLVVVLAVIAGTVLFFAQRQRAAADVAQAQALSRLIANKAERLRGQDPALAAQLSLAAYRTAQTPEARSSLLNATSVPIGTRLLPASRARSLAVGGADRVAAGTDTGDVQLWTFGREPRPEPAGTLPGGTQPIIKLAFSPDGSGLAGADKEGTIFAWDLTGPGRATVTLGRLKKEPTALQWTADGTAVFAATGHDITVLPVAQRTEASPVTIAAGSAAISMLAVSPDGRLLAVGSADTSVYLWDVSALSAPRLLATLTDPVSKVYSVAFSPDGATLAAGTAAEHNIYTWNVKDPARPHVDAPPLAGPTSWVNSVSFSTDGRTLVAASSDSRLWTYSLPTRQLLGTFPHPSPLITAAFARDGRAVTLATDGALRVWPLAGLDTDRLGDSIYGLSFDASGARLGVAPGASDNRISVWDTADRRSTRPLTPAANTASKAKLSGAGTITADGSRYIAGTVAGDLIVWPIGTDGPSTAGPPLHVADQQIEAITASFDGEAVAVAVDDGTVRIVDVTGPPVVTTTLTAPEPGLLYQVAFSPDGRTVAAASINNSVYVWNLADGMLMATLAGAKSSALSVAFSPDSRLLAAGAADGTVHLWRLADGHTLALVDRPLTGPVGYIYGLQFRRDRPILAVGSTDGTVWLWNLTDSEIPEHVATLTGFDQGVLAVAFNPATDLIAAAGQDRTVRLWNTDPAAARDWVCAASGAPITAKEWAQYIPELPFSAPCS